MAKLKTEAKGKKKVCDFKMPHLDSNINAVSRKKFAPQSKRKISWAVNLYADWHRNRIAIAGCSPEIVNANLDFVGQFGKGDFVIL